MRGERAPRADLEGLLEQAVVPLIAGVAVAGVAAQWIGWRLNIPSILILLALGLALGPVFGLVKSDAVLGAIMRPAIGLAVAIIVFEGGLSLNLRELRTAGSGVQRLVFLALPLNWVLGTLAGHYIGGLIWPVAILFGSILVVTGPTVIMPLLRQSKLEPRSAAFLKWEAIVNDPIGATLTLLILSLLILLHGAGGHAIAAWSLAGRAVLGVLVAGALGLVLPFGLKRLFHGDLTPEYLKTPIILSLALGIYAAGESIQSETGLIGATLFGVVLGNIEITGLQELRRFKESLTVFLVSGLFILLAANIDPAVLRHISWPIVLTTLAILVLVRPIAIGLATIGARMTWKERLLVGWIGPRGVVAAAVAGLAADQLGAAGYPGARLVLPMVFMVIAATVFLHGLSLGPLARLLGLASGSPPGLLIVGAQDWTLALAGALRPLGVPTLITDPDWQALRPARLAGLATARVEILSAKGEHLVDLRDLDYVLAATDDDAYNALVCTRFAPELGRERVHQSAPDPEGPHVRTSREWRGKFVSHPDLTNARLNALIAEGWDFRLRDAESIATSEDLPAHHPFLVIGAEGALTFYSDDRDTAPAIADRIVCFEAATGRRKGRRGLIARLLEPFRRAPRAADAEAA
jgi:NhaP-type Na+/H+ or K+/H+ antiporter